MCMNNIFGIENLMPVITLAEPPTSLSKCLNKQMGFVQVPWKPGNMIMLNSREVNLLEHIVPVVCFLFNYFLSLGLIHGSPLEILNKSQSNGDIPGER